jgi:hypothetical protein
MLIELNKQKYNVCENEFNILPHQEYNNLSIRENCGYYERVASLLNELRLLSDTTTQNLTVISATHGGFLPIECSKFLFDDNFFSSDLLSKKITKKANKKNQKFDKLNLKNSNNLNDDRYLKLPIKIIDHRIYGSINFYFIINNTQRKT